MTCRPLMHRAGRWCAGSGAAVGVWGVLTVLLPTGSWGKWWVLWGTLGATVGLVAVLLGCWATARVRADAYGVHSRMLLRRRSVPWGDLADVRVRVQRARHSDVRRVELALRNGRHLRLPLPQTARHDDPPFDSEVAALRALHRRYGTPETKHLPVVSYRTAARGRRWLVVLCVLLAAGAGLAAWYVPRADAQKRAWQAAVPCAADTPAAARGECLTTVPAVIARSEPEGGKGASSLYFVDGRPVRRVDVSYEGAQGFTAGDRVEVTLWRGRIRVVAGEGHVWREHMTPAGDVAVIAAGLALAAAYPAALLLMRRRGRRLAPDDVLPSALPFAGVLAATAVWLLPLCFLHPTILFSSRTTIVWWVVGSLVSLGLLGWAWGATRIRTPGEPGPDRVAPVRGETFLAARFLEHTDYNPHGFGTHVVLGDGPPAVVPHGGPGRFMAKRIPAERLTVVHVRRARGGEEAVRRSWHVADLDDAGTPVRLTAAPADLVRILRELGLAYEPVLPSASEPTANEPPATAT
ncbi:PH domain-containing protein [Streptomyces sp. Ru73]|uniref:PH domain-containing protein n=1 Tax=Streptomyces sp. Ru73 TaxID=2080748 RepID=UPI0035BC1DBE